MHIHHAVCFVFSLFTPVLSNEDYYNVRACCTYRGQHLEVTEYTLTSIFNDHKIMEYNSTRGNWTAFTPYSQNEVKFWNNDPYDALTRMFEKKLLCEDNKDLVQASENLSTAPTTSIKLVKQPNKGHPAMLVCSAYNFYPKQIRMRWLRNKQEVTAGVSYSDVMADGEFTYQMHSFLEYTPTSGEKLSCMLEHYSLSEPKIVAWDNSLAAEAITQIVFGLCGLTIGFIVLSFGLIYYKRKNAEYILSCQATQTIHEETSVQLLQQS